MSTKTLKKKVVKKSTESIRVPQNAQELEQALLMITVPDNKVIQEGTAILKKFLDMPQSIPPMIEQLSTSTNPSVRQLAGVLLRKRTSKHWKKQNSRIQDMIRATLITRLSEETAFPVLMAITSLTCSIARYDIPRKKFGELLAWTEQASAPTAPSAQRNCALRILRSLVDTIPTHMSPHFPMLREMFERYMIVDDAKVRHRALTGLSSIFGQYDSAELRASIKSSIGPLLHVLEIVIREDDEESAAVLFDLFSSLADEDFIDEFLPTLFGAISVVLTRPDMSMSVRDKAAYFITQSARSKPGRIVKCGLIASTLQVAFQLLCESWDDPFTTEESNPQRLGVEIFETFMEFLPRPMIFTPSISCVKEFLGHHDEHHRKGAMILLAVLAEGCTELLLELDNGKTFPTIVGSVSNLLISDPHAVVRTACAACICQMAEFANEELAQLHALVIPNLLKCLENANENPTVREKCCLATDACCEYLGSSIAPYLDGLMTQLMTQLTSNNPESMTGAISAIKSCAISAEKSFIPYRDTVLSYLINFLQSTEDEVLPLRARATECIGFIASAVGVENWPPMMENIIQMVIVGMETDYFELRETSHTFFANLAACLENNVPEKILEAAIAFAIASLDSDEGVIIDEDDEEGGNIKGFSDSENDMEQNAQQPEDDDDDDEDFGGMNVSFRVGAMEEKVAALNSLGKFFIHCPGSMKYLQDVLLSMSEITGFPYGPLRHAVHTTYGAILTALGKMVPATWVKGVRVPLDEVIAPHVEGLFALAIETIQGDEHPETVACAIENISTAITTFGMGVLPDNKELVDEFYEALLILSNEKGICQVSEENNDITAESGEVVLDALCDLYGYMAKMMGQTFQPFFDQIFPSLTRYCDPKRPDSFRSLAIGSIAECVEHIGETARVYNDSLFSMAATLLQDNSVDVRRNAVYLAGTLAMNSKTEAAKYLSTMLQLMQPLLVLPGEDAVRNMESYVGAKDNVISALCKFITTNPETVRLDQYAKVIMDNIPLRSDVLEGNYVYPMIAQFFVANPQVMVQFVPQIISAFTEVLIQPILEDNTRANMIGFIKSLVAQFGPQIQQVAEQLPAAQKEELMKACN